MKIILTRDGIEKSKENTGCVFDEGPAIKFLAELFKNKEIEVKREARNM
ncbi:hypothetical protein [Clostridium sp. DJ247]|nr:hypothetical protein [Clostridium sp. DJ247]MBC2580592.1 hypothetical protein [Clostridium sp. DJ247]